ncbi:hypothetical protein [Tabrizicola aquatica]|uniref:hypothetical protein n=1 Tax=Tabrizicola aquatica TaxID=909926 RepID=UPI0011AEF910|nr:hypothetical protein [Tabrizicola aquatica]
MRWALTRGIAAILLGVCLAFVTVIFELYGHRIAQQVSGIMTVALISGGALMALLGGAARMGQHWMFLRGMPAGRLRSLVLRHPVLRWWYGVDCDGQAVDD